ncbi:MAG: DUF86 domain-containing protein [Cyanobacteria bacterium]|nr:DUF86 domain-containing protein [Cyanobacteriota bacterium]MDA1019967.1 DUF86 domain-containing protein [Cyanobacteriota bacterium]
MNIDLDLIHAKIRNIQNCLNSIKKYTRDFDLDSLDEIMVQDSVIINVERASQACVDIASHIVSKKALGVPLSMGDAFYLLYNNEYISSKTWKQMNKMVGFRNVAVHEYDVLDIDILKSVIKHNLVDFENFYKEILTSVSVD